MPIFKVRSVSKSEFLNMNSYLYNPREKKKRLQMAKKLSLSVLSSLAYK